MIDNGSSVNRGVTARYAIAAARADGSPPGFDRYGRYPEGFRRFSRNLPTLGDRYPMERLPAEAFARA